ncbi:hypothetical protein VW35_16320 [Devosia soli]|uniref:Polyketide cyclase n=1 Tax=Devosia soli TaxID=361041 RepID=A0A0F5L5N5_9HYPH|nr:hypothetical protein [Devosia soli]KKB76952.1 hypothetical protein VW35_16320 [Devosia soli]
MRRSHTIATQIDYPYEAAYRYLADPASYAQWAAIEPGSFHPLDNGDWTGETRFGGLRHIRFTPPNDYGVLDHAIFVPGEALLWTPMRVVPNEEGTELLFTFLARPGMSEDMFDSAIEWITTDFLMLKSILEARRR